MDKKIIAIINPLVSAKYLSDAFKNKIWTLAVYTMSQDIIDAYSAIDNTLFDEQIFLTNAEGTDIALVLKNYRIDYILNGAEESTILTDKLTELLTPDFINSSATSLYRFDKLAMQDRLRIYGLPTIKQITTNLNAVTMDMLDNFEYPIFCKPRTGYGSRNAFQAFDKQEAYSQFMQIKKLVNNTDEHFLIQELVEGVEYIVDTFSVNGNHCISAVRKYHKINYNGVPLYRYSEVVYDIVMWKKCTSYIKQMLDALDFNNGFAHTEIMIKNDGTIKLIELNNRIGGDKGYTQKLTKASGLIPQDEIFINWIINNHLLESQPEQIECYARNVYLFNFDGTPLKSPEELLKQHSSVQEFYLLNQIGTMSNNTRLDLTKVSCFVLLKNDNLTTVDADCNAIFAAEQSGMLL